MSSTLVQYWRGPRITNILKSSTLSNAPYLNNTKNIINRSLISTVVEYTWAELSIPTKNRLFTLQESNQGYRMSLVKSALRSQISTSIDLQDQPPPPPPRGGGYHRNLVSERAVHSPATKITHIGCLDVVKGGKDKTRKCLGKISRANGGDTRVFSIIVLVALTTVSMGPVRVDPGPRVREQDYEDCHV